MTTAAPHPSTWPTTTPTLLTDIDSERADWAASHVASYEFPAAAFTDGVTAADLAEMARGDCWTDLTDAPLRVPPSLTATTHHSRERPLVRTVMADTLADWAQAPHIPPFGAQAARPHRRVTLTLPDPIAVGGRDPTAVYHISSVPLGMPTTPTNRALDPDATPAVLLPAEADRSPPASSATATDSLADETARTEQPSASHASPPAAVDHVWTETMVFPGTADTQLGADGASVSPQSEGAQSIKGTALPSIEPVWTCRPRNTQLAVLWLADKAGVYAVDWA